MSLPQPSQSFFWTQEPWGIALRCRPLLDLAPHLFTTRAISVSRDVADPAMAMVAASLGLDAGAIVQAHQVHGRAVVEVRTGAGPSAGEGDVLICNDPVRAVGVRVADCVPLLVADDTGGTVAAVHAGWRGVARRAPIHLVHRLQQRFGVRPERLVAAVGPSIGPCCYEVGADTRNAFRAEGHASPLLQEWFLPTPSGRFHLDLWRAVRDQLEGAGLMPAHIFTAELCTMTHTDLFHSFRRDKEGAGRLGAFIRPGKG